MRVSCWAPGRVNLMGEHTDHSGGLVLPIAIQLGITITYEPAEEMALRAPGGERFAGAVERELAELGRPNVGIAAVVESDLPQGAGLVALLAFKNGGPGMAGALSALALDLLTFYSVFVAPKRSTAALALLFTPLWSTLVVVPVAVFGTAAVIRWRSAKAAP